MNDGKVIIGTELDTSGFEKGLEEIKETEGTQKRIVEAQKRIEKAEMKIAEAKEKTKRANEEIRNSAEEIVAIEQSEQQFQKIAEINNSLELTGASLKNIILKVGKWGLALFGIRSAYSLIRSAMSTITSEDEQIATDIEYMKWVLAQTLKPVVEWIVNALYTTLALINSITTSLFNFNILAGKSTEAFKNSKKSIGGMSSALKDAKKQLAGFDEMNVLQDNTSTGGGAGGGMADWEAPDMSEYAKQIQKIKDEWISFGSEMEEILNLPLGAWFDAFGVWGLVVRGATEFVHGLWEAVSGLFEFISGIVDLLVGLITGDTDKIYQGIYKMLEGLWKIIDGLIKAVWGLVQMVVGLIVAQVLTFVNQIIDYAKWWWETTIKVLSIIGDWIYKNVIKPVADFFVGLWNGIIDGVKTAVKWIKDTFNNVVNFFKGIISTIVDLFKKIGTKVGDAIGGAFKTVINGVLGAIEGILNFPIKSINKLIDVINKVPGINLGKLSTFNLPRLARGGIVNNPGSGVMMGNYIAGEKGAEAVLPLTDGTLQKLANMMPITVHVTNTMNGRVLSREIQRVQNENDFAFNG